MIFLCFSSNCCSFSFFKASNAFSFSISLFSLSRRAWFYCPDSLAVFLILLLSFQNVSIESSSIPKSDSNHNDLGEIFCLVVFSTFGARLFFFFFALGENCENGKFIFSNYVRIRIFFFFREKTNHKRLVMWLDCSNPLNSLKLASHPLLRQWSAVHLWPPALQDFSQTLVGKGLEHWSAALHIFGTTRKCRNFVCVGRYWKRTVYLVWKKFYSTCFVFLSLPYCFSGPFNVFFDLSKNCAQISLILNLHKQRIVCDLQLVRKHLNINQ